MSEKTEITSRSGVAAFGGGAIIGTLGGLIGLGGAELRLPLLIIMFHQFGWVVRRSRCSWPLRDWLSGGAMSMKALPLLQVGVRVAVPFD